MHATGSKIEGLVPLVRSQLRVWLMGVAVSRRSAPLLDVRPGSLWPGSVPCIYSLSALFHCMSWRRGRDDEYNGSVRLVHVGGGLTSWKSE